MSWQISSPGQGLLTNGTVLKTVVEKLTASSGTWTPPGIMHGSSIVVRVWGAGGDGANGASPPPASAGSGGGGGGFAEGTFTLTPAQKVGGVAYQVAQDDTTAPNQTWFASAAELFANSGADAISPAGGLGGSAGGTASHVAIQGGDGATGSQSIVQDFLVLSASGGIGGASPRGACNARGGALNAAAGVNGDAGDIPGGGGGGGNAATAAAGTGGAGARGQIEVEYLVEVAP